MAILSPTREKPAAQNGEDPPPSVRTGPAFGTSTRWRAAVAVSAGIAGAGLAAGLGIIGMAINDGARGSFATVGTYMNPARFSFSVWSVIYLGLLAYVAWQMTKSGSRNHRARQVAKLAALSMVLNAAWILAVQLDLAVASLFVMAALLINLFVLVGRLSHSAPRSRTEWVLLDGVFQLYLSWVLVSSFPNAAIVLRLEGLQLASNIAQGLAVTILVGIAVIALAVARRGWAGYPMLVGLLWGTATIALARLSEPPYALPVAVAAFGASAAIVLAMIWRHARAGTILKA